MAVGGPTENTDTMLVPLLAVAMSSPVGLNATDTKCIDLILRQPDGTATAGQLSQMTGLTTGAITHILDRLEKREFIERVRDTKDRRKVFVRVLPNSLEPLGPKYETMGKAYMALAEEYSDAELQLICKYMEKTSEVTSRQWEKLTRSNHGT